MANETSNNDDGNKQKVSKDDENNQIKTSDKERKMDNKETENIENNSHDFEKPSALQETLSERINRVQEERAARQYEEERERREAEKAAKEFSPVTSLKGRCLQPIYDDNGEVIGYQNPLHIGHLDLRVGKVRMISRHPQRSKQCRYIEIITIAKEAKKSDLFWGTNIDTEKINAERNITVESGIPRYSMDTLVRQKVILICNCKPFKSRGVESKVVVLCAKKGTKIELLKPPDSAVEGDTIVTKGYPNYPQTQVMNIMKHLGSDLRVNKDGQLVYKDVPLLCKDRDGYITAETLTDCSVSNVMGYDFI